MAQKNPSVSFLGKFLSIKRKENNLENELCHFNIILLWEHKNVIYGENFI